MQNLVPHFILEKHALGEYHGRFDAVCLFADVSGFSAVTHTLIEHGSEAAEVMANIMGRIFEPMVEAVYARGGFISQFAGDAFTAVFPASAQAADICQRPVLRALAAARSIQRHFSASPVEETQYGSFPFAIKLGLADGGVDWGILRPGQIDVDEGPAPQDVYYFSGPAIDAAAEAEHLAQPGNLVLSPALSVALAECVQVLPVGDQGHARLLSLTAETELPPPDELPPPQVLAGQKNFIPAAILEHSSAGEFRQVVTVFINLLGIHSHADLEPFIQAVFNLQREQGGYLARVDFGDKGCNLLLFWGTPTSSEKDVERALQFTLALRDCTPGSYKAGLTFSQMYAGLAGSSRRGEWTCYGDGINLAARLMMAAPWGGYWLDERLAKRAGGRFILEQVGEQVFKGFDVPQAIYALLEKRSLDAANFFHGKLVGHDAEMAKLDDFVRPLLTKGRFAGILSVEGEAGLGKSRLVTEFLLRLTAPAADGSGARAQWALCQTNPTLRSPFNPWRYWLRNYFEQSPDKSAVHNKRAFGRVLDRLIATTPDSDLQAELNHGRSFLGALLDLYWENSPYAIAASQGRYELTLTALTALVRAESLRCPLVINIEDAHWLDSDSLVLIERLVQVAGDAPFAILATSRPVIGKQPLFGDIPYQRLELRLLNQLELVELAQDILGAPIDPDLATLLEEHAEGNPFFAEQILLFLREQGRLLEHDGRWKLGSTASPVSHHSLLPSDVRLIFTSRLDSLSNEVRDVVQTAAILGREFEVRVLSDMLRKDERLSERLREAENSDIWTSLTEIRYLFKHALLRDAAYEMQLRGRRRGLHRLAAEALEKVFANDLTPHYAEIAYHYQAAFRQGLAEVRLNAVDYLERAGAQAVLGFENAAAVQAFTNALELLELGEDERRWQLLLAREGVYGLTGEREAQLADLGALAALAEARQRPGEQASVALRRGNYEISISNFPLAIIQAQNAVRLAQAAGQIDLEAKAQQLWGETLWRLSDYPAALEQEQQALTLVRAAGRGGDQSALASEVSILVILGNILSDQGDLAGGLTYYERALELSHVIGDRGSEGRILINLGCTASEQGNEEKSQSYLEQSLAISQAIGYRSMQGIALANLGVSACSQGNLPAARNYFQQSIFISQITHDRDNEAFQLAETGNLLTLLGDFDSAQKQLENSLSISRSIGSRRFEAQTLVYMANLYVQLGQIDRARELADEALALAAQIGNPILNVNTGQVSGQVYLLQGNYSRAREHFEAARATAKETGNNIYLAEVLAGLAWTELQEGNSDTTRNILVQVAPILEECPSLDGACNAILSLLQIGKSWLALQEPCGAQVIETAYQLLQKRTANLPDEMERRAFLENVTENRELCTLYAQLQSEAVPTTIVCGVQSQPDSEKSEDPSFIFGLSAATTTSTSPARSPEPSPAPIPAKPANAPTQPAAVPAPAITEQPPAAPLIKETDKTALAAQILGLLGQTTQAQGVTLIILGDVHIHQIVLGDRQSQNEPERNP